MAGKKEEFTVETKLKIAGVEAIGTFDAGTLKFNVDSSSFKDAVKDAAAAAIKIKQSFSDIKANNIEIGVKKASINTSISEIREAFASATEGRTVKFSVGVLKASINSSIADIREVFKSTTEGSTVKFSVGVKKADLNSAIKQVRDAFTEAPAIDVNLGSGEKGMKSALSDIKKYFADISIPIKLAANDAAAEKVLKSLQDGLKEAERQIKVPVLATRGSAGNIISSLNTGLKENKSKVKVAVSATASSARSIITQIRNGIKEAGGITVDLKTMQPGQTPRTKKAAGPSQMEWDWAADEKKVKKPVGPSRTVTLLDRLTESTKLLGEASSAALDGVRQLARQVAKIAKNADKAAAGGAVAASRPAGSLIERARASGISLPSGTRELSLDDIMSGRAGSQAGSQAGPQAGSATEGLVVARSGVSRLKGMAAAVQELADIDSQIAKYVQESAIAKLPELPKVVGAEVVERAPLRKKSTRFADNRDPAEIAASKVADRVSRLISRAERLAEPSQTAGGGSQKLFGDLATSIAERQAREIGRIIGPGSGPLSEYQPGPVSSLTLPSGTGPGKFPTTSELSRGYLAAENAVGTLVARENELQKLQRQRLDAQKNITATIDRLRNQDLQSLTQIVKAEGDAARAVRERAAATKEAEAARQQRGAELDAIIRDASGRQSSYAGQLMQARGGMIGGGRGLPPRGGFGSLPRGDDDGRGPGKTGSPSEIARLGAEFKRISDEAKRATDQTLELDTLAFQVGRKAAAFRGVATAINAIADSLNTAVTFAISFNDSLQEINKILQLSGNGLTRLGDQILSISKSSGATVEDLAQITETFARAGLAGRGFGSVLDLTQNALLGLQGTTLDAAQASTLMIQVIQQIEGGARGLGKELITTSKLFDVLGRVEDITASKAQDFAEAFRRSGASLVATGSTLEEIVGLIAVVQERTQRGGEVIGTAFKTISTRLANTGSEAAQALKSIGVNVTDSEGRLKKISDILLETSTKFEGLTEAEQANIATKVAGLRQIEIFRNAVLDYSRILEVQREAVTAEGDAARKQAIEQNKLSTVIQKVKNNLLDLVNTLSKGPVGTAFKNVIGLAEQVTSAISNVNKSFGGVLVNMAAVFLGIKGFKMLVSLIQGMGKAIAWFGTSAGDASKNVMHIGESATTATSTGIKPMGSALQQALDTIRLMNTGMREFHLNTQMATAEAERMAAAEERARLNLDSKAGLMGAPATAKQVEEEKRRILLASTAPERRSRQAGLETAIAQQGARKTLKDMTGEGAAAFTDAERKYVQRFIPGYDKQVDDPASPDKKKTVRVLTAEKEGISQRIKGAFDNATKKINATKFGKSMAWVGDNITKVGVTSALAGSLLSAASEKLKDAGYESAGAFTEVIAKSAEFASLGALFGPWGALIGGVGGAIYSMIGVMGKAEVTIDSLTKKFDKLGLVTRENGQISDQAAADIEKAYSQIKGFQDFQAEQERIAAEDPERAEKRAKTLKKELEDLKKGLETTVKKPGEDESGEPMPLDTSNLQKFLEGFAKVQGVLFTFDPKTLQTGAEETLADLSKEQAEKIFKILLTAFEKISDDGADIFSRIIEEGQKQAEVNIKDLSQISEKFIASSLNVLSPNEQASTNVTGNGFGVDVGSLRDIKVVYGGSAGEAFNKLESLASNLNMSSDKVTRTIGSLRIEAQRGMIQTGKGESVSLEQIDELISGALEVRRKQELASLTVKGSNVGEQAILLAKTIDPLIKELGNLTLAAKEQTGEIARQDERNRIFKVVFDEFGRNIDVKLGQPVSELSLSLRKFSQDYSASALRLQQATLKAITPQEKLAEAMVIQSRKELSFARSNVATVTNDAIAGIIRLVDELGAEAAETDSGSGLERQDIREAIIDAFMATADEIRSRDVADPREVRQILGRQLTSPDSPIGREGILEGELVKITEGILPALIAINDARIKEKENIVSVANAELGFAQDRVKRIDEEMKLADSRREISKIEQQTTIASFTGLAKLNAEREIEVGLQKQATDQQRELISALDALIAENEKALAIDKENVSAQNQISELQKRRTEEQISLEKMLAETASDSASQRLAVMNEIISMGDKELSFLRTRMSAEAEITDTLRVGATELEKVQSKLDANYKDLRVTQAQLAAEVQLVNSTIEDEGEKKRRLADITRRGAEAAIQAAQNEAQLVKERRDLVKGAASELVSNQQEQQQAQKAVMDATKSLSDAYLQYRESVRSALLAASQYNIELGLAKVAGMNATGAFSGVREQISAVNKIFRDAESQLRQVGAGEKALVEIRKQSISQQISLFNQLLNEQSGLARSFFQSSAQDQADLFRGIQEAKGVADILGGGFDKFKMLGEKSINDIGAQLLSLPQETRQRIISSLETLRSVGGSVGGFTADELLTAIETASLGVSGEGLEVDPLFEIQEKIASLTEEQARLATDQLISANEQVATSKKSLEEAQAAKDLAQIQLDRTKEEGDKLRSKLAELTSASNAIMLDQNMINKNGFDIVTQAIRQTTEAITNQLPSQLSSRFATSLSDALTRQGSSMYIPGVTPPPVVASASAGGNIISSNAGISIDFIDGLQDWMDSNFPGNVDSFARSPATMYDMLPQQLMRNIGTRFPIKRRIPEQQPSAYTTSQAGIGASMQLPVRDLLGARLGINPANDKILKQNAAAIEESTKAFESLNRQISELSIQAIINNVPSESPGYSAARDQLMRQRAFTEADIADRTEERNRLLIPRAKSQADFLADVKDFKYGAEDTAMESAIKNAIQQGFEKAQDAVLSALNEKPEAKQGPEGIAQTLENIGEAVTETLRDIVQGARQAIKQTNAASAPEPLVVTINANQQVELVGADNLASRVQSAITTSIDGADIITRQEAIKIAEALTADIRLELERRQILKQNQGIPFTQPPPKKPR